MIILGTWGYEIFADDITADIKDDFEEYIEDGLSVYEATERILERYQNRVRDKDDTRIYLALASLQMEHGELQKDIKQAALDIIERGEDLEAWEGDGKDALVSRKKVLNKMKSKLQKHKNPIKET
jgi:hypothetical protein